ncbi:SigE family RNA polymerase sigma factor [Micromonospora sp. NPDC047670]|uniref:SigE family RNA polymerase sigma factor n=1 Tax=Micromonospora sp. NPDC047670 TaxID=3364252 RepID=UPI003722159B
MTDTAVDRDDAFRNYVAARAEAVRFTAYLMCGDWHEAEDLAQSSFIKLYLAWDRIDHSESIDGYVQRIVTRTFLNGRRQLWRRRERLTNAPPETLAAMAPGPEQRMLLWAALAKVPPRQRATLVLRYWEDLSVEETARILDCSVGNVKSQCARGLRTLRELLEAEGVVRTTSPTAGGVRP